MTNTTIFANLFAAITAENQTRLSTFINELNKCHSIKDMDTWHYNDLMPKGKKVSHFVLASVLKEYLIARKAKQTAKEIDKQLARLIAVQNAPDLQSITVSMEWKKSRMWGMNPNAEARINAGDDSEYYQSGSIGGCGYDKGSTAVANAINQSNAVLKALYLVKENNIAINNRELFGYGSGHGILPYFEGGVGVSCYPAIFDKIGFEFKTTASGKTFDVYTVTKKVMP